MKGKLLILLFMLISLFFQISCDNGKSNPESDDDIISTDQTTADTAVDEKNDADSDSSTDTDSNMPDEDVAPSITIKCPETINENSGKVLCEIFSVNNSVVLADDDTCYGQIENETTYSFTPGESFGPGTCIAKIRDTVSDEIAQAEITINEVNNPPIFTSSDFDGYNFYEETEQTRDFYYNDPDLPKDKEGDPGYVVCSIRDNTCGFNITVETEFNKCVVKGTMPEELTSGDCEFKLVLTDGYGEEAVETVSASLTEENLAPTWNEEPASFVVNAGTVYSGINGKASDTDLPNLNEGDPGYLNCKLDSDSCSFDVSVSSLRDAAGSVSCKVDLTSNDLETCNIQYHVTDGIKTIYSGNIQIKVNSTISIDCPESVNEGEEIICDITAKGGNPGALSWSENTCHGSVFNEEGNWKYRYTTTENDGPKNCNAAVGIDTATASSEVEIKEVNTPPELSFNNGCADPGNATATEGQDFYCNVSMSDVDRPNSDPGDPGYITCEIKNNTCGGWLVFDGNCNGSGKPDEESGGAECSYSVEVSDGYGEIATQTITIAIAEQNNYPEFTTPPITQYHLIAGEHLVFTYSGTDSDLPDSSEGDPGYLKCSVTNDVAQSSITSTGVGFGTVTCNVEIDAYYEEECASGCPVTFEIEDGSERKKNHYAYVYVRKCIFFVKPDGTGTRGRDWNDAFGTIQQAVDEAWEGCEIWVKQGTYTNPAEDKAPVVTMKDGVKIIGGFEGFETYDDLDSYRRFRPENPIAHSVLDGEDDSYHVVVGSLNNAALDGFIVTGGNADGTNDEEKKGGGMYNKADSADFSDHFVSNTIFIDNFAEYGGGAVYNDGFFYDSIYFYNCEFLNNSSVQYGGAILSENAGHITYLESEFSGNSSNAGGAIAETSSRSNLNRCLLKENEATTHGGAIVLTDLHTYDLETQVFIVNSILYNNSAGTLGGAISGGLEQLTIDHSTFANNTDPAIVGTSGDISNSIFWNNSLDSTGLSITYTYGSGIAGTGNIESIPAEAEMFINENSDLHLDPTSPAIDSADPSSTLTDDIEGNSRPSGNSSDMGAYEHVSIEADYFVDCEVASTGDGSSWASPKSYIRTAISATDTVINFDIGIYEY